MTPKELTNKIAAIVGPWDGIEYQRVESLITEAREAAYEKCAKIADLGCPHKPEDDCLCPAANIAQIIRQLIKRIQ